MNQSKNIRGEVVDIFCGIGALSHGFKLAGFNIIAGYDIEASCKFAFEYNNNATFYKRDIKNIEADEIKNHFTGKSPSVLIGCAPCQPFSKYRFGYDKDPQFSLLHDFARLAIKVGPDYISMENVPTLLSYDKGEVFKTFVTMLEEAKYFVKWNKYNCESFGIPQRRKRLVLIASRTKEFDELFPPNEFLTVRQAIGKLPKLQAGETDPKDTLHKARSLSPKNMERIKASTPGGKWTEWPTKLRADCHKKESGKTYTNVYARMEWDKPSPTITTQFGGFGNGRFGHPEQNRAISFREGAILQSFPPDFKFHPDNVEPNMQLITRWIGNAVPVKLANSIANHIANIEKGE